jgi:hypothetical protein
LVIPISFIPYQANLMHAKDVIREALAFADMTTNMLLEGISDREMLVRSVPGANHIAWQYGHLIASEKQMIEMVKPNSMPPLPAGFEERYDTKNSQIPDETGWYSKADLQRLAAEQRAGTLKVLDSLSDKELAAPAPEMLRQIVPTSAGVFILVAGHWLNHTGQFTPVRRKLGKPHAF